MKMVVTIRHGKWDPAIRRHSTAVAESAITLVLCPVIEPLFRMVKCLIYVLLRDPPG